MKSLADYQKTVFWIEGSDTDLSIVEGTLQEYLLTLVEEFPTPKGVGPAYWIEEVEGYRYGDDQDFTETYDAAIEYTNTEDGFEPTPATVWRKMTWRKYGNVGVANFPRVVEQYDTPEAAWIPYLRAIEEEENCEYFHSHAEAYKGKWESILARELGDDQLDVDPIVASFEEARELGLDLDEIPPQDIYFFPYIPEGKEIKVFIAIKPNKDFTGYQYIGQEFEDPAETLLGLVAGGLV